MDFNKTINNKRIFVRDDGSELIDLTQQNFKPSDNYIIYDFVIVHKDYQMRPDLLAQEIYGNINNAELLLKQGGISNPFSLDENDFILLQELSDIESQFVNNKNKEKLNNIRNQYIDSSKASETDKNFVLFENRKKLKNKKQKESLPPNISNIGDQEIKLSNGNVIYGEDVSGYINNELEDTEKLINILKNNNG